MSVEENTAAVKSWLDEAWNKGNLNVADEVIASEMREQSVGVANMFRTAFPDHNLVIEDLVAEGDKVVARWSGTGTNTGPFSGIPPTGKKVTFNGISIFRLVDGKIAENWIQADNLDLMQQLGVISMPG